MTMVYGQTSEGEPENSEGGPRLHGRTPTPETQPALTARSLPLAKARKIRRLFQKKI